MIIVFLLRMIGDRKVGDGSFIISFGGRGVGTIVFLFFCAIVNCFHGWCMIVVVSVSLDLFCFLCLRSL